jgi:hypothetical protein
MTNFALIAGARTGSSTLHTFCNDLGLRVLFEPFRPSKWTTIYDVREELGRIYDRMEGIKHLYDHLSLEQNIKLVKWLVEKEIRVIFLTRRNKVFQALSKELAFQTGYWQTGKLPAEQYFGYLEVSLSPINVLMLYEHIDTATVFEDTLRPYMSVGRVMNFEYEDLYSQDLEQNRKTVHALLTFIEKPPDVLADCLINEHFVRTNKQNILRVYQRIPNWEEIRQEFQLEEADIT